MSDSVTLLPRSNVFSDRVFSRSGRRQSPRGHVFDARLARVQNSTRIVLYSFRTRRSSYKTRTTMVRVRRRRKHADGLFLITLQRKRRRTAAARFVISRRVHAKKHAWHLRVVYTDRLCKLAGTIRTRQLLYACYAVVVQFGESRTTDESNIALRQITVNRGRYVQQ